MHLLAKTGRRLSAVMVLGLGLSAPGLAAENPCTVTPASPKDGPATESAPQSQVRTVPPALPNIVPKLVPPAREHLVTPDTPPDAAAPSRTTGEKRVYTLDAEAGSLTFGDGQAGRRPAAGSGDVQADYRYGEGQTGKQPLPPCK